MTTDETGPDAVMGAEDPLASVLRRLSADPGTGLSVDEAAQRLARLGPNQVGEFHGPSIGELAWRQAKSFIVLLLLAAAVLSALLGQLGDALAILVAVLLNGVIGFAMEYRAEQAVQALQALAAPTARVRRGGQENVVPARELVPGDIVRVSAGDRIPADGRLTEGACTIDESLLTGESLPVSKHAPADPIHTVTPEAEQAHAGTLVQVGDATLVVTATGARSNIGRIAKLLADVEPAASPVAHRLEVLGHYLLWTILAVAAVIIGLGWWQGLAFGPLIRTGVVLAIAAIPEGLPIIATLALAVGSRRLARQGALVRRLPALESLGMVTTLCLDKTGTLTANAMTLQEIQVAGHTIRVTGTAWTPVGEFLEDGRALPVADRPEVRAFMEAGQLCNDALLEEDEGGWHIHGDPSDGAFLVLAAKAGLPDQRAARPRRHVLPFGADHPWMLVALDGPDGPMAYIKGAPEVVLARCATELWADGPRPLDESRRQAWQGDYDRMADEAMRVLGVARKPLTDLAASGMLADWEWLGLGGMADPPRPGVKTVLAEAHQAGIRTVMITGDHPTTAAAIARELDLAAGRPPKVAVGTDSGVLDADVYARVFPEGKLTLVQALQREGQVVAMTGDGVNDGPALRSAAVGIAMGNGADVAKEASAVILTDERLATLMAGVREGRAVFLNLQKGLDYLLTCSLTTMLTVLLTTAAGLPLPLLPLQILYLNLLTHTFPALGLTLEPADADVMNRPPLPKGAALLPPARMAAILWHGLIIGVAALSVGAWGTTHQGVDHGRTLVFTTLASALMLHALSDRSTKAFGGWHWGRNPLLFAFLAATLLLQVAALGIEPLRHVLGMTLLDGWDWLTVWVAAALTFVAVELSKKAFPEELGK